MRCSPALFALATMLATAGAAGASGQDLSAWFFGATSVHQSGKAVTTTPDFLPGKSMTSMHCGRAGVAIGGGIWQLVQYDRRNHIGLAAASTDQCSIAIFKASPPGVSVPDADLSQTGTGRGIRIGSAYSDVLAAYGGKRVNRSGRFVVTYAADVPGTSITHPKAKIKDPETIIFVIENGRVSAMTVSVDLGGEM